ncbi:MAG: hypothetical protein NZT92_05920 [Abditibacteriales bacterium]|nr:hypothetical protein [Abditibacteriales bacterium]MDW8365705.1 hypothetical protein [Abditibacteriales bacterium]
MSEPMTKHEPNLLDAKTLEAVMMNNDLADLTPEQRLNYYNAVCESLGLNPYTQPFQYLRLQGKLTLYARRDCTDQLRKKHNVSIQIVARERLDDVYIVTARATMPDGRTDESIGVVSLAGLRGNELCNAFMRAETKAKRRVTLSIVGLGWLDESEIETVSDAQRVTVNMETGVIENAPEREQQASPVNGSEHRSGDSKKEPHKAEQWHAVNARLHARFNHEVIHNAAVRLCKVDSVQQCTVAQLEAIERYLHQQAQRASRAQADARTADEAAKAA